MWLFLLAFLTCFVLSESFSLQRAHSESSLISVQEHARSPEFWYFVDPNSISYLYQVALFGPSMNSTVETSLAEWIRSEPSFWSHWYLSRICFDRIPSRHLGFVVQAFVHTPSQDPVEHAVQSLLIETRTSFRESNGTQSSSLSWKQYWQSQWNVTISADGWGLGMWDSALEFQERYTAHWSYQSIHTQNPFTRWRFHFLQRQHNPLMVLLRWYHTHVPMLRETLHDFSTRTFYTPRTKLMSSTRFIQLIPSSPYTQDTPIPSHPFSIPSQCTFAENREQIGAALEQWNVSWNDLVVTTPQDTWNQLLVSEWNWTMCNSMETCRVSLWETQVEQEIHACTPLVPWIQFPLDYDLYQTLCGGKVGAEYAAQIEAILSRTFRVQQYATWALIVGCILLIWVPLIWFGYWVWKKQ